MCQPGRLRSVGAAKPAAAKCARAPASAASAKPGSRVRTRKRPAMSASYPVTLNGPSTASLYHASFAGGFRDGHGMIDNFALGLTHGLMLLAAWRLLSRPDLGDDDAPPSAPRRSWFRKDA